MQVSPFLLDRWLNEHQFAVPPIEFDLAASTGPRWTWSDLISTLAPDAMDQILDRSASYAPATGTWALRQAIADMAEVSPGEVIVVTGASEGLWILMLVAGQSGGNVVLPHPGYPTFGEAAGHVGLEVRQYQLRAATGHAIDVDEVEACIDERTVLVLVNTPHNPTGAVVSDEQLPQLSDLAEQQGTRLVVDEVYHPIYHGQASTSAARLDAAITVGDFSKALCLSGLRIGWIIDHDQSQMQQYEDARAYLSISSSPLSEALAEGALRARDTIYARARTVTATNLVSLDAFMAEHADQLDWVRPAGGMTALPWLRSGVDARPLCTVAAAAGVLIAPGDCFGVPAHFRVGFGVTERRFPDALDRLADILQGA